MIGVVVCLIQDKCDVVWCVYVLPVTHTRTVSYSSPLSLKTGGLYRKGRRETELQWEWEIGLASSFLIPVCVYIYYISHILMIYILPAQLQ